MDWFEMLDKAKAMGREYALNGIAGGQTIPGESPLSGEWAGAITPRDIITELAGGDAESYEVLSDWEVSDILDAWEDGYNGAPWPSDGNGDEFH